MEEQVTHEDLVRCYKKSLQECEEYAKWAGEQIKFFKDDNTGWKTTLRLWSNRNEIHKKILVMYLTLWKEGTLEEFYTHPYSTEANKLRVLEQAYMDSVEAEFVHERALELRKKLYKN
jgi:hypothetical protein